MTKLSLSIAAASMLAVSASAFAQGTSAPAAGSSSTTASSYSAPTTVHQKKPRHKKARQASGAASAASE